MLIRPYHPTDAEGVWGVLKPIIRAGESYALPRSLSEADGLAYWLATANDVFVAESDGDLVGTYYMRANQLGGGDHVANCAYATAVGAMGRGVGRVMCEHSLEAARDRGFRAMQFNFVVSTNDRALALWRRFGFEIVGTLPGAFRHPERGQVDALVLFRRL